VIVVRTGFGSFSGDTTSLPVLLVELTALTVHILVSFLLSSLPCNKEALRVEDWELRIDSLGLRLRIEI
jgi:hypothetical protein